MSETKTEHYFKNKHAYDEALKSAPNESHVKSRSLGGGRSSKYVPIEHQQALADLIFATWNVIDEKYFVVVNEIICTVKIEALPDYPNAEPEVFTGTGAKPIQTNRGSKVEQFPKGKITNSLEYNAPAARAAAMTSAFATKGNIFGRHLSRKINSGFSYNKDKKKKKKTKK